MLVNSKTTPWYNNQFNGHTYTVEDKNVKYSTVNLKRKRKSSIFRGF